MAVTMSITVLQDVSSVSKVEESRQLHERFTCNICSSGF
jgi:hypothetical protein